MTEYLASSPVVATHSVEEAREAVSRIYLRHTLTSRDGAMNMRFNATAGDHLTPGYLTDQADAELTMPRFGRPLLEKPLTLARVEASGYDVIAIPGGHGPVEDLYKDPDMGRILVDAQRLKKIIAPVCHGQAALLAANDEQGNWLFAGRKMTAFSDEEEVELGTADNAPWLLADTLRKRGACYEKGKNWGAHVVKDGNLLSGQNPASTAPLVDAVLAEPA